jgi:hypothetical protein
MIPVDCAKAAAVINMQKEISIDLIKFIAAAFK